MNHVYQLVLLGEKSHYRELVIEQLLNKIELLGMSNRSIQIINRSNFRTLYKANNPTYCLYFGNESKKMMTNSLRS